MSTRSVAGKMFRLLHKHQELILDAYADGAGELTETDDNGRAIEELIRHRLAWQPDADSPAMLSSSLRQLLDHGLRNERLTRIDVDIDGRMTAISQACSSYLQANARGDVRDASSLLLHVKEQVYELTELLHENARKLWRRIESDFDYVESIAAKQQENQQTLELAENLIHGLNAINVSELQQQAGADRELKRLFGLSLPAAIDTCRKELVDALHRLGDMLFRLRKLEQRGQTVRNVNRFFAQNPGVDISVHANRRQLPAFAQRFPAKPAAVLADIANPAHELPLTAMLVGLRKRALVNEFQNSNRLPVDTDQAAVQRFETPLLKQAIRSVFIDVLQQGKPLSAKETHQRAEQSCDLEQWLHGLAGEYNAMQPQHRQRFQLQWQGQHHAFFDGNFRASDLVVERQ